MEDRFDVHMWRGDFTSKYLEEITKKTGKERTYPVFIQLLQGSILNSPGFGHFFLDLLGFQDLILLKAKSGGSTS